MAEHVSVFLRGELQGHRLLSGCQAHISLSKTNKTGMEGREMAQWLRAPAVLAEDPGSVPNTYTVN